MSYIDTVFLLHLSSLSHNKGSHRSNVFSDMTIISRCPCRKIKLEKSIKRRHLCHIVMPQRCFRTMLCLSEFSNDRLVWNINLSTRKGSMNGQWHCSRQQTLSVSPIRMWKSESCHHLIQKNSLHSFQYYATNTALYLSILCIMADINSVSEHLKWRWWLALSSGKLWISNTQDMLLRWNLYLLRNGLFVSFSLLTIIRLLSQISIFRVTNGKKCVIACKLQCQFTCTQPL